MQTDIKNSRELQRLDVLLAQQRGLSRVSAREIIVAGNVYVGDKPVLKPGLYMPPDTKLTVTAPERAYVSRGGDKLQAAILHFDIDVSGRVCLDVGASTGGFTDCLLQGGASMVYAIENGKEQLSEKLQGNKKVISMEETDIRQASESWFHKAPDLATVDVSFISLKQVLAPIVSVLAPQAELICLVKPQFEAGKGKTNRRGIIRNPKISQQALDKVNNYASSLGLQSQGHLAYQAKKSKNQEFLVHYKHQT